MQLLHKLMRFRETLDAMIAPLEDLLAEFDDQTPQQEERPEILLRRAQKDRRSEKNVVVGMTPLNGAPTVPEDWRLRKTDSPSAKKNRALLAQILDEYEPMTRRALWELSRSLDARLDKKPQEMKNYQQMVGRLVTVGRLKMQAGKIVRGK